MLRGKAQLWIALLLWSGCSVAVAQALPVNAFYGQYIGHGMSDAEVERDLSVTIGPTSAGGFFIAWATVSHKHKTMQRKDYEVRFVPSPREHIYSSAMRTNVFGGQISLDPLKGDPYVWARIKDSTLTVHSLTITAEGGYQMQIYNRTLNEQGLLLEYRRLQSGEPLRQVTAQLVKVAD
ncbi:MAG: hypothetical protein ACJAWL_002124 [Motiliproteus sp.]|jgi:hypothetical protein